MSKRKSESVGILGIGSYVPEKILTNSDLEKMVDTSDEWITKRTGISERRILEDGKPIYSMAVEAAKRAIKDSGLTPEDIDLIIVSTTTPDYLTPTTSCMIHKEIGAVNASAFDLGAACSGFIYAMTVAQQFIENGCYKHVMIVGCEGMSRVTDWTDRNTCVLFGDGAGAVILGEVEEGYGILSSYMGADGSGATKITIPCLYTPEEDIERRKAYEKMNTIWQDGQEVFKFAVKILPAATEKVVEDAGLMIDDIKYIIPHQANIRILESSAKRLGVPMEKVYLTIQKYGNISSASVPIAMDDAYKGGCLKKGDNIVLVGFGGGLTWASAVIKWSK